MAGTGLCERTIRRCVAELADVIAVHHEPGKAPVWQFLITVGGPPPEKMSASPDKNVRDPGQNCRGYIRRKDPSKEPSKDIRSSDDEQRSAEFVSWYSAYPRKIGKRDAEKAYRRLTATQRKLSRNQHARLDRRVRHPPQRRSSAGARGKNHRRQQPDPAYVPEQTRSWRRCVVSMELVSGEVARLGGLDRFPRNLEALKELALAFQRHVRHASGTGRCD